MHFEFTWHGGLDLVEELAEFRGTMQPMAFADDRLVAVSRAVNVMWCGAFCQSWLVRAG